MTGSLMLKSLYAEQDGKPQPIIVDCGYMSDPRSREAFDALIKAGVSRKRFSVEGFNRLFVELPPRKANALIADHPIKEGGQYWRSTHHWQAEQGAK